MNRIIAGLALAGAVVASAPPGHADPGTDHGNAQFVYTVDLARAGITGPMFSEIVLGETICDNLAHGLPITTTVTRLLPVITAQMAVTIVSAAVMDLCPQYAPSAGTSSPAPAPTQPVPVTIASAIA